MTRGHPIRAMPLSVNAGPLTDFIERMWFDLRELVLHIVGIHGSDLVPGGRAEYFDDLYKLINARFSRE